MMKDKMKNRQTDSSHISIRFLKDQRCVQRKPKKKQNKTTLVIYNRWKKAGWDTQIYDSVNSNESIWWCYDHRLNLWRFGHSFFLICINQSAHHFAYWLDDRFSGFFCNLWCFSLNSYIKKKCRLRWMDRYDRID